MPVLAATKYLLKKFIVILPILLCELFLLKQFCFLTPIFYSSTFLNITHSHQGKFPDLNIFKIKSNKFSR